MIDLSARIDQFLKKQLVPKKIREEVHRGGKVFPRERTVMVKPEDLFDPTDYTVDELEEFVKTATMDEAQSTEKYATSRMEAAERLFRNRTNLTYRDYDNIAFLARRRMRRLGAKK